MFIHIHNCEVKAYCYDSMWKAPPKQKKANRSNQDFCGLLKYIAIFMFERSSGICFIKNYFVKLGKIVLPYNEDVCPFKGHMNGRPIY